MKHWLFMRATNRPLQWEGVTKAVNNTDQTFVDQYGSTLVVPANTQLLPPFLRVAAEERPQGPILRQFDKDITNLALVQDGNDVIITQSFLPPQLRNADNARTVDLGLMEQALEQHQWVSLSLLLNNTNAVAEPTLLRDSQYLVRDDNHQLKLFNTNEVVEYREQINALTLFVAFRLGKTNGYVLMCNHNILSGHTNVGLNNNERTVSSSNDQTGNITKFAFDPKFDCEVVANTLVVEKDYLKIEVGHNSLVYYKADACLLNNGFVVKSSWDAEIKGNVILVKKQPGMGYIKITFDCNDLTKPYITSDDRKITLEYLLLGV
jgi:hypothetical protein